VLGQPELATQYYRRVLALDPTARLPDDASPRLRPPFIAAQSSMAAHGRLTVRAERRAAALELRVVSDPLGMVAAVRPVADGKPGRAVALTSGVVALDDRRPIDAVWVLDEHGNTLVVVEPPARAPALAPAAAPPPPPPAGTPILRRWLTWAIPAAIVGGIGAGLLVDGQAAKDRLDQITAASSTHFLAEAEQQRARWQSDTRLATVAFTAAGALAVTAVVMAATGPSPDRQARIAPLATPHAIGLAWASRF
jgi:hypothetical protein